MEPAVSEVREKRKREPAPRIDIANTNYFERLLQQVPSIPADGPPPPVQKTDTILGLSREDQLARINRMAPKDLADFVYNNPHQLLELTAQPTQPSSGPPALYEIKDGTKVACVLDRSDYRLVLATVQQAIQSIAACKHHSKERCDCWRVYRDPVGYFRNTHRVDHPIAVALAYYWNLVEATAQDRPKKDATLEALQQLTTKVEAIAEQQTSLLDTQDAAWVGRKKGSGVLGGK